MKMLPFMPVVAAVLLAAACEGDTTTVDTRASVRFFNATTGMTGGGFTTNGQFAAGSALALGQAAQGCAKVDPGLTSFGFGAATPGGTGLSGSALATLNNQSVAPSGNYIMVAAGSAASPQLYLLDNNSSTSLPGNQAAVRFVNLAPGTNALPNSFYVFSNGLPPAGAVLASNVVVGAPTAYTTVTSGSNAFMVMVGHLLATRTDATFNLPAGSVNTIAIAPNSTSTGFELINLPRC